MRSWPAASRTTIVAPLTGRSRRHPEHASREHAGRRRELVDEADAGRDGLAVLGRGLEGELARGLERRLVEAVPRPLGHHRVRDVARRVDRDRHGHLRRLAEALVERAARVGDALVGLHDGWRDDRLRRLRLRSRRRCRCRCRTRSTLRQGRRRAKRRDHRARGGGCCEKKEAKARRRHRAQRGLAEASARHNRRAAGVPYFRRIARADHDARLSRRGNGRSVRVWRGRCVQRRAGGRGRRGLPSTAPLRRRGRGRSTRCPGRVHPAGRALRAPGRRRRAGDLRRGRRRGAGSAGLAAGAEPRGPDAPRADARRGDLPGRGPRRRARGLRRVGRLHRLLARHRRRLRRGRRRRVEGRAPRRAGPGDDRRLRGARLAREEDRWRRPAVPAARAGNGLRRLLPRRNADHAPGDHELPAVRRLPRGRTARGRDAVLVRGHPALPRRRARRDGDADRRRQPRAHRGVHQSAARRRTAVLRDHRRQPHRLGPARGRRGRRHVRVGERLLRTRLPASRGRSSASGRTARRPRGPPRASPPSRPRTSTRRRSRPTR